MLMRVHRQVRALLLGGVALLVLAEVGLRLVRPGPPRLWRTDPLLGHALRPGASGWCAEEGDAYVTVNSHGMRDRERTPARTPNTLRVAVLGDSMAEARQVAREAAFPALLEAALSGKPELGGRAVEVLNFGVSGYSTGQEVLQYRNRVAAYQPDIVLLQFSPVNDVRDNHAPLGGERSRPYFRRDGRKVMRDERFRASASQRRVARTLLELVNGLSDHSHLVRWIAHHAVRAGLPDSAGPGATDDERCFGPSPDDTWREAWVITERLMIALRDEVQGRGSRLMVMGATYGPQVHPEAAVRDALARKLGQGDLLYPEARLAPFLVGNGIPFLPLAAVFQRRATANRAYYHGFARAGNLGHGHWNKEGHALAAELVAPWLLQHLNR